jgi:hypothetical protein
MTDIQNLLKWASASSLVIAMLLMIGCAQATAEPTTEETQVSAEAPAPDEQTIEPERQETSSPTPEREVRRTPTVRPTGTVPVTTVTVVPGTRNPTTAATTQATSIAPTNSPSTGDASGSQGSLSAEEQAALSAGNASYSGQRCRIAEDFTCNCIPDTITASFSFSDANAGLMIFNATTGTATYQIARKGINTWISSSSGTTDQGTVTIDLEIIFNLTGFQQIVTVRYPPPGGQAPTCTANWTRQ